MTDRDPADRDHWDEFAEAMDLTIEGHRLIAQEIAYEFKMLWRAVWTRSRDLLSATARWGASPPA